MFSFSFVFLTISEIWLQQGWIRYQKKRSMGQHIKIYGPERHLQEKGKTPTMGGVVFLLSFLMGLLCLHSFIGKVWLCVALFPLGMGAIGLVDDLLKHLSHSSEGFTSRQKLFAQVMFCFLWIMLVQARHPDIFFFFHNKILDTGLTLFLGVGIVNAVNITDGLDGLAAFSTLASFLFLGLMTFGTDVTAFAISVIGIGITLGFLWHNTYPALVFMGDVGSHFLGGLLFVGAVFSGSSWIVIPLSTIFAVEIMSVIIQLWAIHFLGRKIFAMSPLHHHFELQGIRETRIVIFFTIFHVLCMALFVPFIF